MADRLLTDWLASYLVYTSPLEAPTQFHFWSGVSAVAGALRRKIYIDQEYFIWSPNLYIILVAPSGVVAKSTTSGIGMGILEETPGAHFGPDSLTWQSIFPILKEAQEQVDLVGDGLLTASTCLTFYGSELSSLLNFDDKDMVSWLIQLWDNRKKAERYTKKDQWTRVPNPWVNIIACTTPGWIAGNIGKNAITDGLISRFLFVYGDKKRKLVAYPKRHAKMLNLDPTLRSKLVHDLAEISTLFGEFKIEEAAYEYGEKWYDANNERLKNDAFFSRFDGYASRKQGYAHKLAMVLSAAEGSSMLIERRHLEHAVKMLDELEPDMHKVFGQIGMTPDRERIATIEDIVRREGSISKFLLYRLLLSRYAMTHREFEIRLADLVQAGVLKDEDGQISAV